MAGHPTWDSKCPAYINECTTFATRIPDNLYRYFPTSEEWTWERLTNAKPNSILVPPPFRPTSNSFNQPPPPHARGPQPPPFARRNDNRASVATSSNDIPLGPNRATTPASQPWRSRRTTPATPTTGTTAAIPLPEVEIIRRPGAYTPSAPSTWPSPEVSTPPARTADENPSSQPTTPHPHPENIARPSSGGATITPKRTQGTNKTQRKTRTRKTTIPGPSQRRLTTFLAPSSTNDSSASEIEPESESHV